MDKTDIKKEFKHLYSPPKDKVVIVDVPELQYLMIDGTGNPNNSETFSTAIETLYTAAYTAKSIAKKELNKDFVVQPLEGLWWVNEIKQFSFNNKDSWNWTLMIVLPGFVTKRIFEEARKNAGCKKPGLNFDKVKFEKYSEGKSAQLLYTGDYKNEKPAVEKLHAFVSENGYTLHKKHHEIYLSDPRKTAPEKLKTILRNPII